MLKPNLIPCIYKGITHDNKLSVFYMKEDHQNEVVENVMLVGMPQFTKKDMELEYYEEKVN